MIGLTGIFALGDDHLAPTVTSTRPGNGAAGVAINPTITATFSKPIDPETMTTTTFVVTDSAHNAVPGTVGYDPANRMASFRPSSRLSANTTYNGTIIAGVTDVWGTSLASDYTWAFTTGAGTAFGEDFESPQTVQANWSPYGSAFSVSNGVGTLLPDGSVTPVFWNYRATIHDKGAEPIIFQDLVYEVDVKLTPAIRTALCFGLRSGGARFWVGYDIGRALSWWSDDLQTSWGYLLRYSLVDDYRPYDGQWHRWRVEVSGTQFDFWVDNHHVLSGQLDGYLPGPIGMRSWDAGGAQFDNLMASVAALPDGDGDGVLDSSDNCPVTANANQANTDGDALGDACDACPNDPANDTDGEGECGNDDNCPADSNGPQANADGDALGDACDLCPDDFQNDADADGVCGNVDNCPVTANANQANADGDALGDACDACPADPANDTDGDGVCGNVDNCPQVANAEQADSDGDGRGNACDNCPTTPNADQADGDNDGVGEVCDRCPQEPATGDGCPLPSTRIGTLIGLVAGFLPSQGERSSLTAKLEAAGASLARGNRTAAANQLNAFINEVRALQRSGRLGAAEGDFLAARAQSIVAQIQGG
ncbi:MAG: Ig-like domain-containing protein [Acidobacteria bacterium]|nr:Ig-like domain-containing protein [Acidobacteriota bacterium]